MANINAGPVNLFKVPFYAADGSVPSEGDVLYRGLDGLPTWGSAALVARTLESKADLAAIQAMATISRAKVYYAADTGKQYMWTGGGVTTAWEVAEVNSGLALGETSATAFAGDKGAELYALKGNIPTSSEKTRLSDIEAAAGSTTALKLAELIGPASENAEGVIQLATQAEANAGANTLKAITPKTFAGALEAGQIITTTLAVDGGFAATNFGSTEAISGGTANG